MAVTTPSSISFYLNTPVVLSDSNSEYYGTAPYFSTAINLMVRWEDHTKEIVGLNETYEPINAVEGFDLAPIRRALNSCVNIFNLYGCF